MDIPILKKPIPVSLSLFAIYSDNFEGRFI